MKALSKDSTTRSNSSETMVRVGKRKSKMLKTKRDNYKDIYSQITNKNKN